MYVDTLVTKTVLTLNWSAVGDVMNPIKQYSILNITMHIRDFVSKVNSVVNYTLGTVFCKI